MKDIPVHQLKDKGNAGFEIVRFVKGERAMDKVAHLGVHRDDHYLFFVLEKGSSTMMIDFSEVLIGEGSLFYILPGQVHKPLRNDVSDGWFIAVDPLMVAPDYRAVFEYQLLMQQPVCLSAEQLNQFKVLLNLLLRRNECSEQLPFHLNVLHSLLKSFTGMAAGYYNCPENADVVSSRPVQLARQFKRLLAENIQTLKSPSAYAEKLNISESYLNEALKKVTGFSVSYWILQEIMIEAKRLLYYSKLNVKEIAYRLGYQDATYFSRVFKKSADVTPLEFRDRYRK